MAVNGWTINDASTVLNAIITQAGGAALDTIDSTNFATVARSALSSIGTEGFMSAMTQVLTRTIITNRSYSRKFGGIEVSKEKYGNWTRKISFADSTFSTDKTFDLPADGSSVDPWIIKRPNALQLNYYGKNSFGDMITISEKMLETAVTGYNEFMALVSAILTNISNRLEAAREQFARATIANYVAGKVSTANNGVVYLLSEYGKYVNGGAFKASTDSGYANETFHYGDMTFTKQPENYKPFMQWVFAEIAKYSENLTERSTAYAVQVTGKAITRFTPKENQKLFMLNEDRYRFEMTALADVYHDNFVKYAAYEYLNYWQTPASPASIKCKPVYINPINGSLVNSSTAVTVNNVFAVLLDENTLGYAVDSSRIKSTPENPRAEYYNVFYHEEYRSVTDFTENGLIFIMGYNPADDPSAT